MAKRRSRLALWLIILLVLVYTIETSVTAIFDNQTLAPILAILSCAFLVFLDSPRLILISIPLFAIETYFLIRDSSQYPLIRTSTMIVGGGLAFWACCQRQSQRRKLDEVDMILRSIQTPWILCDRNANITRAGHFAAGIVNLAPPEMTGLSFFSTFGAGPAKGELIRKFMQAADSRVAVHNIPLVMANDPKQRPMASFLPVETSEGIGVLVLF